MSEVDPALRSNCYLCGLPIVGRASDDHVIPKQFIRRAQPKAKGFDYGEALSSHPACNNNFGPERMVQKALDLLKILEDDTCFIKRQSVEDPNITVLILNIERLKEFSEDDLRFFRLIDGPLEVHERLPDPAFFKNKRKANPKKQALTIARAVLVKSACALLISRYLKVPPPYWRVIAIPYFDESGRADLRVLLGESKPFDDGLDVWVKQIEFGDWFVAYRAREVIFYLIFTLSGGKSRIKRVARTFEDAEPGYFGGQTVLDVLDHEWQIF